MHQLLEYEGKSMHFLLIQYLSILRHSFKQFLIKEIVQGKLKSSQSAVFNTHMHVCTWSKERTES